MERVIVIIFREFVIVNIDICVFSEVRCEGIGNIVERDYIIYWSGGNKKEVGVGFVVFNRLLNVIFDLKFVLERIMVLWF